MTETPPGETPLDYLLRVMRDPLADPGRRDRAAACLFASLRTRPKAWAANYNMPGGGRRSMEDAGARLIRKLARFRSEAI